MTTRTGGDDMAFVATPGGRVIVGYDGSPLSIEALHWASAEAAARYAPLRIVAASIPSESGDLSDVGVQRRTSVADHAIRISTSYPDLRIEHVTTVLDPRDALLGEVTVDDLLVVGASRGNIAKIALFGSVARAAARRSPCPVVVVHERPHTGTLDIIMVGVDGSSAADAAIEWVCSESRFHGSDVEVVHAWADGPRAAADHVVARAVERCRALTPNPVRGTVASGSPVDVLIEASQRANLVAVGSRRRSGFTTAMFGSVALAVASRGHCPVAVTHPHPLASTASLES